MADKNAKNPKNVAGKYYVDTNCISCGQCVAIAPDNFSEDPASGNMYIAKQPATDATMKACHEALESCPVEAIGEDGA